MIFCCIRHNTDNTDLGALVQRTRDDVDSGVCTEESQQQLQLGFVLHPGPWHSQRNNKNPAPAIVIDVPQIETKKAFGRPSTATLEDQKSLEHGNDILERAQLILSGCRDLECLSRLTYLDTVKYTVAHTHPVFHSDGRGGPGQHSRSRSYCRNSGSKIKP